jgi:hypothetical protein
MPTRGAGSVGQLDEISQKIGELTAYTHEHRHGVNNLSAKFDALALDIAKRVEALDTKMTVRIDEVVKSLSADNLALSARLSEENNKLAVRVAKLEDLRSRQDAQLGVWKWIVDKWPFAALAALLSSVIAWANGKLHF